MELRAQLFLLCHAPNHVFRKLLRLQGAEAHTLNTRRSAGRFNGVTQMQTELLSVCRKVDARQHHFFVAVRAKPRKLRFEVFKRLRAHTAAGIGNDTV